MAKKTDEHGDPVNEGRERRFMDIDRMMNEGLGGGRVTEQNGLVDTTTTDSMDDPESVPASGYKTDMAKDV